MAENDDIDSRRLALEERKAADTFELRRQELEIEAARTNREPKSQLNVAAITVLSALVGGIASIGAAFLSGHFSVQETNVQAEANSDLEEQKFSYELITTALSEPDAQARAIRLKFLLDIGLLENLKVVEIARYANAEQERIKSGGNGLSELPLYNAPSLSLAQTMAIGRIERYCSGAVGTAPTTNEITACIVSAFKELSSTDAVLLLESSPIFLSQWLAAGSLPNDWRNFLP